MGERTIYRLRDIVGAIDKIDTLLNGKTFTDVSRMHSCEPRSSGSWRY